MIDSADSASSLGDAVLLGMRARAGQTLGPHGERRVCNVDEVRRERRREVFHGGDNELRDQLGRPLFRRLALRDAREGMRGASSMRPRLLTSFACSSRRSACSLEPDRLRPAFRACWRTFSMMRRAVSTCCGARAFQLCRPDGL